MATAPAETGSASPDTPQASGEYVPRPGCLAACSWGNCYDGSPSRWRVKCDCGFLVTGISSGEAAEDTYRWHKGLSSALGDAEREHFDSAGDKEGPR